MSLRTEFFSFWFDSFDDYRDSTVENRMNLPKSKIYTVMYQKKTPYYSMIVRGLICASIKDPKRIL